MNVTHNEDNYRGDGYDIIISFSLSDFAGGSQSFYESARYKLFKQMTEENLQYNGQHSEIARQCALEWLSGGRWKEMLEEVAEYRKLKDQEKKSEEENKLTVEKCLTFLQEQGYNFCISSTN